MADDAELKRDDLLGPGPHHDFNLILAVGNNVVKGQILGYITASKKVGEFDSGGAGGLEVLYGIALHDADASTVEQPLVVWVTGVFKRGGLIFANSGDAALADDQDFINDARKLGIILKKSLAP